MKTWRCHACETEFLSEASTACRKCGSTDIECLGAAKASPEPSHEASEEKTKSLPAVREVLRSLCRNTYETTFEGMEWEGLIEEAIEELEPYIKTACTCKG